MKKILTCILIMTITLLTIINISYGEDTIGENIEVTLTGPTKLEINDESLTLTLKLGDFIEISDNIVLGYETVLEYDSNLFESVEVKGLNGWTVSYSNDTKRIIGDTTSAKANTEITQIVLKVKSNIQSDEDDIKTNIKLNNLIFATDNKTLDKICKIL